MTRIRLLSIVSGMLLMSVAFHSASGQTRNWKDPHCRPSATDDCIRHVSDMGEYNDPNCHPSGFDSCRRDVPGWCPSQWKAMGMNLCNGKCYAQGTMSRYDNPCFAAASPETPPPPPSCWGKGLEQPECAQWNYPRSFTAALMANLVQKVVGDLPSAQVQELTKNLKDRMLVGNSGGWAAGQAVAAMIGEGDCTRHFYNKSDSYWSVALIDSGRCHLDGDNSKTNGNVCMVPPHRAALLDYSNLGSNSRPQILIAGTWPDGQFSTAYDLKEVGCEIQHSGSTGNVVLNSPAKGDVVTCGRDSYPCR
jgi:hypothetical protein